MIPYAYHENSTSTPPTRTRHCACHKTHVWNFGAFIHQGNEMRHNIAPSRQDQTQISAQRHPTPPQRTPANANPGTATKRADTCAGNHAARLKVTFAHYFTQFGHFPSIQKLFRKLPPTEEIATRQRANATRLGTQKQTRRTQIQPQTPDYKREIFATHSGITYSKQRENVLPIVNDPVGDRSEAWTGPSMLG